MGQSGCSESHACLVLQPKRLMLDHPVPIGMTVIDQYYCALLLDKMRPAVCLKQQELLEHGVILL